MSAERASEWRSIDSAPRDGTRFVAWCVETGQAGPDIAWWRISANPALSYFATKYGWIPTHWMPLPAPPKAAGDRS